MNMQKFKWLLALIVCMSIHAMSLCFQGPRLSTTAQTNEQKALFVLIDKLENSLPFTRESVSKLLGLTLRVDTNKSDDFKICSFSTNGSKPFIKQIAVTEPTEKMSELMSDDGAVLIDINRAHNSVALKDVLSHFGKESYVVHHRKISPRSNLLALGYVYIRSWGRLEFELEPNSSNDLSKIHLDSYQLATKSQIASNNVN